MKKSYLAVAFLVIILLAGIATPLFSGLMMERIVRLSFDRINQGHADKGSDLFFEIQHYDRKFFSSRIEWKIKTGVLKKVYGVDDIVLIDHAKHGVSTVVSNTSLEKNKWFMDFVNNKLNGKNPVEMKTKYSLSGDIESTIRLAGFSFKDGTSLIEIKPGKMVLCLDKEVKNISSDMTWAGCRARGKFDMGSLFFNSKMERKSPYIWDGYSSFGLDSIKSDGGLIPFEAANLKADHIMRLDKEGNKVSIEMGYGVDSVTRGQNQIKDGTCKIHINNMDAKGYEEFMILYSQIMKVFMDDIAAAEVRSGTGTMKKIFEKQMTEFGIQLLGRFEKILKKGFEIQVSDLKAQVPQGHIKGDITLSLKKDMTMAQFIPIMFQPAAVLDIFSLKSDISLPEKLVGDNPMLFSPVYSGMQTGLFLKKGDNVIHKAETRDGKLFLNGKKVGLN